MANKKIQSGTEVKKIIKKWVPIYTGNEFNNENIGEAYVSDIQKAIGTVVELNLMILTNDPKRQGHSIKFRITEAKNNVLYSEPIGCYLQTAQLKRMTRTGKNKVEDSFAYETNDNVKIVVKPIFITKTKTNKSKLSEMRLASRKILGNFIKNVSYSQLVKDVVSGGLQKELKNKVNKVYPMVACVVKTFEKL